MAEVGGVMKGEVKKLRCGHSFLLMLGGGGLSFNLVVGVLSLACFDSFYDRVNPNSCECSD